MKYIFHRTEQLVDVSIFIITFFPYSLTYLDFFIKQYAVKWKQKQQGRTAAVEELVSRLLGYKHWKADLQEALSVPGSGLEDLGDMLSSTSINLKSDKSLPFQQD